MVASAAPPSLVYGLDLDTRRGLAFPRSVTLCRGKPHRILFLHLLSFVFLTVKKQPAVCESEER